MKQLKALSLPHESEKLAQNYRQEALTGKRLMKTAEDAHDTQASTN